MDLFGHQVDLRLRLVRGGPQMSLVILKVCVTAVRDSGAAHTPLRTRLRTSPPVMDYTTVSNGLMAHCVNVNIITVGL